MSSNFKRNEGLWKRTLGTIASTLKRSEAMWKKTLAQITDAFEDKMAD